MLNRYEPKNDFILFEDLENIDLLKKISKDLEDITHSSDNPALLGRSREYFENQIKIGNVVVFLDCKNNIIASGVAQPLQDGVFEYGSIFVEKNNRGKELGKEILSELRGKVDAKLGILTVKPNEKGNAGMIVDAMKAGFVPISYEFLSNYNTGAFEKCCCCDSLKNGKCEKSDNYCILLVENTTDEIMKKSLEYLSGNEFLSAVSDIKLREKIIEEISFKSNEIYQDRLNRIKEFIKTSLFGKILV